VSTPLDAEQADLDAIEKIVRSAGTSFYRGMTVLPPDRRHAMYAIYAFCRLVDDIADEETAFADKLPRLGAWRERIEGLYRGEADDPVTRVLLLATRKFGLRRQDFLDMIDGMQMDAEEVIVAPDLVKLDLYCDRVAASVGRLSVRAFGDSSADADRVAYALGRALQLTNILRDVAEDADRDRLYLPREYLEAEGVPADPKAAVGHPGLTRVCQRLAALAQAHFRDAHRAMDQCDPRAMKPARLMGATYGAILTRLEAAGWADLSHRVSLPKWQKAWLAVRYGLL
jgi:squalene synthase HpnD